MILRKLLILLFISAFFKLPAQFNTIGYPFLKNFERFEYQAGLQSWMISQAPNGMVYFANNDGLMEFDGQNWTVYPMPDRTIIRSVYAASDGKIYVGSSNNLGCFQADSSGILHFNSFLNLIPADKRNFEEVWKIYSTKEGIVFQAYKQIIIIDDEKAKIVEAPSEFHFSFHVNNTLYIVDKKEGILQLINGKLYPLKGTLPLNDKEVCSILPYNAKLLIATIDHGVFIYDGNEIKEWKNPATDFLIENQIYTAIRIDQKHIAFGTIQNGLLIATNEGNPVLILNESNGLQNNTILCMLKDLDGNLWLGTDNGIDLLYINLALSKLDKNMGISAGYAAIVKDGILYLGTNRGVFYKKWDNCFQYPQKFEDFKLIEETKGQVWKLQIIDSVLFCGHNNGAYIINKDEATKISDEPGAWTFFRSNKDPDKIICGTYTGLIVFIKEKTAWRFLKKLYGFNESSRIMELDNDGTIWMSHGFKGVYHIVLNENQDSILNYTFYDSNKGFDDNYGINVTKLKNQIVFTSPQGVYKYDESHDRMEQSEEFNTFFSDRIIDFATEDRFGDIWFFGDKNCYVKRMQEDGSYTEISLPFKPLKGKFIGGFQFVYSISEEHVLLGYENGFIHYNPTIEKDFSKDFQVFIQRVSNSRLDSSLFKGHLFSNYTCHKEMEYKDNSLHFYFSAVNFENNKELEFSTYLKGFDNTWSDWEKVNNREFTNLKEGKYAFYVKARNIYNNETKPIAFEFTLKPPWSRSSKAYITYFFLVFTLLAFIVFLIRKRIQKLRRVEKKHQEQKFIEKEEELQKQALIREKEIVKLRNEKLRQEMKNKDKELADATMQMIKKNKFLINVKNEFNKMIAASKDQNVTCLIKSFVKRIEDDINNEKNWKIFESHFLNVHEEFLIRLKKDYPQISPAELKLCACLRMNLSTKEIASLLNISIRGVEAGRYRLRKSLDLDRQTNLTDFVLSF